MTEWMIIAVLVGLIYKLSKLRVIHLEFGEGDDSKPRNTTSKRKQLKK